MGTAGGSQPTAFIVFCEGAVFSLFLQPIPSKPKFLPPFRNIFYVMTPVLVFPAVENLRKKYNTLKKSYPPRQADSCSVSTLSPRGGSRRLKQVLTNGAILNQRFLHAAEDNSCISGRGWTWERTRAEQGPRVPGAPADPNSTWGWRRAVTRTLQGGLLVVVSHRRFSTGNDMQTIL